MPQGIYNRKIAKTNKGMFQKGHPPSQHPNVIKSRFKKGNKTLLGKHWKVKNTSKMHHKPWNKGMKGFLGKENHYNWKGGITSLELQIRHSFQYRQWRSDVFTRDNFTCQKCGKKGGYLEAHHCVKSFSDILEEYNIKTFEEAINCVELWNINNGMTVHKECHPRNNT